jgi:cyclophilin family peptidyl-prolyl cis-trans isomerase
MPRKKQVIQRKRRQKSYGSAEMSASSVDVKSKGVFRLFHNYWLFAIIGTVVMVGSIGFSAFFKNTTTSSTTTRGAPIVKATPEASTTGTANNPSTKSYTAAPPNTLDPNKTYRATIKTDQGDVTIDLLAKDAPETVNNFVFLANQGFYNGLTFYRVIADPSGSVQFVQGGDPTGLGTGGPGYTLPFEAAPNSANLFGQQSGVLAMAKPQTGGADNNGSQFFITLSQEPTFDGKWTAFGKVTSGLDVLSKLTPRDPQAQQQPPEAVKIDSISITAS